MKMEDVKVDGTVDAFLLGLASQALMDARSLSDLLYQRVAETEEALRYLHELVHSEKPVGEQALRAAVAAKTRQVLGEDSENSPKPPEPL